VFRVVRLPLVQCTLNVMSFIMLCGNLTTEECVLVKKRGDCDDQYSLARNLTMDSGVKIAPAGVTDFSVPQNIHTCSGDHPAYSQMDTGSYFFPEVVKSCGVTLTTQLHLVPRLNMREAVPPVFHTSS
jgi:hypothetical protein